MHLFLASDLGKRLYFDSRHNCKTLFFVDIQKIMQLVDSVAFAANLMTVCYSSLVDWYEEKTIITG